MAKDEKRPRKGLMKKSATKNKQPNHEDSIAKSKRLVEKIQRRKSNVNNSFRSCIRSKDDSRVCSNGKPMPPLSELERMYEDSDDDIQSKSVSTSKSPTHSSQKISLNKLTSPKTIKKIADKMMDLIANLPDPTVIHDDASPSPPKKQKKSDCIDCPQSCKKSSTISCNSDDVFRIASRENNECPTDTLIEPDAVNVLNSGLNTNSDNIVSWLQDCEKGNNSDDSNKTVDYDCAKSSPVSNLGRSQLFSPLPSTSKDKETIHKNDQLFNESLISETSMSNKETKVNTQIEKGTDSDMKKEPKEIKQENDNLESVVNITNSSNTCDLEMIQTPYETIVIDDDSIIDRSIMTKYSDKSDIIECIDIVEPVIIKETKNVTEYSEPIVIDDEDGYKFINDSPIHDEVTEVIDIDNIIAENKAIIKKYSQKSDMDINTVTCVNTSTISSLNTIDTAEPSTSSAIHNTTNKKRKDNIVTEHGDSANTQRHNNNKIQDIVTNYFSNNTNNQNQNTEHRNAVGTRLCNKVNEWIDNLTPSFAFNRRTPRIRTQSVDQINDSVIEIIDVPSPALNIPSRSPDAPSPTRTERSDGTIMRINGEALCDPNLYPKKVDLGIEEGSFEYLHVYYHGDDVHITGDDGPPAGIDTSKYIHKKFPAAFMYEKRETLEALIRLLGKYKQPGTSKNFGDCPICMESLTNKSVASTICGHVFCMRCIEAAFKASGKRCPTCRKVLKKGGYHQIFV